MHIHARQHPNVLKKITEIVNNLPKEKAMYRLELMTLKALRIAYLMTAKPLAGE
jgi:hypothetical protein